MTLYGDLALESKIERKFKVQFSDQLKKCV